MAIIKKEWLFETIWPWKYVELKNTLNNSIALKLFGTWSCDFLYVLIPIYRIIGKWLEFDPRLSHTKD